MNGLVFFLNGDRVLAVLEKVIHTGHGVRQVYASGRRDQLKRTAEYCRRLGVRMAGANNVNAPEFVSEPGSTNPRLLVVAGYSTIFRRPLLDTAKLGAIKEKPRTPSEDFHGQAGRNM